MNRDRPLGTSMFLQDHNSGMKRSSIDYGMPINSHNNPTGTMSKSTIFNPNDQQKVMQQRPQLQQFQQYYMQDNPQYQNVGQTGTDKAIYQLNERLEKLSRTVDKHESQLNAFSAEGDASKKILNEIRQNMPAFSGNNDVFEHIFNIKLDIKAINEEIEKMPKYQDLEEAITSITASSSQSRKSIDSVGSKPSDADIVTKDILRKRDEFFQKILANLEGELMIVKKNIGSLKTEMKVSPISSSSCIMLKYQELFKARNKNQSDMIISEHTYYLDNEGYLLDCHSRYLVDQKGKKVRVEEKHLTMLRNQGILQ